MYRNTHPDLSDLLFNVMPASKRKAGSYVTIRIPYSLRRCETLES